MNAVDFPIEDDDRELLAKRYALQQEAWAINLALAKKYLFDEHWKVYSEFRWYRKVPGRKTWAYNLKSDFLSFGSKNEGGVNSAFEWLLQEKAINGGTLPYSSLPISATSDTRERMFKPAYVLEKLSPRQKSAHYRVPPPQDWLAVRYGWDEDIKSLFSIENGRPVYNLAGDFIMLVDSKLYASWRVRSMLLFGNEHGMADVEQNKALLAAVGNYSTGLGDILLEVANEPPSRARELTAAAVFKEQNSRHVYPVLTDEEKRARVQEIKARRTPERARMVAEAKEAITHLEADAAANPHRRRGIYRHQGRTLSQWKQHLDNLTRKR